MKRLALVTDTEHGPRVVEEVRCDGCKHWGVYGFSTGISKRGGNAQACHRVELWSENGHDPMPSGAAVNLVEPYYSGGLYTDEDFGCALFEPKETP